MNTNDSQPGGDGAEKSEGDQLVIPQLSWYVYDGPDQGPCGMFLIPSDGAPLRFKGRYHEMRSGLGPPTEAIASLPFPMGNASPIGSCVYPNMMMVPVTDHDRWEALVLYKRHGDEILFAAESWLEPDQDEGKLPPPERVGAVLVRVSESADIRVRLVRELTYRLAVKLVEQVSRGIDIKPPTGTLADEVTELLPLKALIHACDRNIEAPREAGFVRGIEEPVRASSHELRDFLDRAESHGQRVFTFPVA